MLDAQVQIAARRRSYGDDEQQRLLELFGDAGSLVHDATHAALDAHHPGRAGLHGETLVELNVPCTYDFEVTAAKYLQALGDGDVPLEFLFSGTVFYTGRERGCSRPA